MKKTVGLILVSLVGFAIVGFASGGYDYYHTAGIFIWLILWTAMVFLAMLCFKENAKNALLLSLTVFVMMSFMIFWAETSSCNYQVFRTKAYFKLKYGDELVLRGENFHAGNTNAVYYRKSEPEYYFHANTSMFSLEPFDQQYKQAVAAAMIDDMIEELIRDVIPGEFKMSSECMSMCFHEELDFTNVYSMMARTSYFQMYCVLDNSLVEHKDEIIENVTAIIAPLFKNAKATIYFAFVSDVQSSERYGAEYSNAENILVRLDELNK